MKGSSTSAWYTRFARLGSFTFCWLRCGNCPIKGIALIVWKCGHNEFRLQSRKIHLKVENAFDADEWNATSIVSRLCELVRDQFLVLLLISANKCLLINVTAFRGNCSSFIKWELLFLYTFGNENINLCCSRCVYIIYTSLAHSLEAQRQSCWAEVGHEQQEALHETDNTRSCCCAVLCAVQPAAGSCHWTPLNLNTFYSLTHASA